MIVRQRIFRYRVVWKANMKVREFIKLLVDDGWYQVGQKGSHRQFKHGSKLGKVTMSGNPNDDIKPGTLVNLQKQAGFR